MYRKEVMYLGYPKCGEEFDWEGVNVEVEVNGEVRSYGKELIEHLPKVKIGDFSSAAK